MDDDVVVSGNLIIPSAELSWRFGPSGGPGGQHANTSNTAATVSFDIAGSGVLSQTQRDRLTKAFGSELTVTASDERSQFRNRQLATERLAAKLAEALKRRKPRRPTRRTRGSNERRISAKKQRGQRKADRSGNWD